MIRYFGSARVATRVSRHSFYPEPGVDSVLIDNAAGAGEVCAVTKIDDIQFGDVLHSSHDEDGLVIRVPPLPAPMYGVALELKQRGQEQKLSDALHKLAAEDPSLRIEFSAQTNETVLRGMGELHLRLVLERVRDEFGLDVATRPPKIAYRETLTRTAEGQGRHKKQSGGHGQYGICNVRIEPLSRGEGFVFEDKIFGGSIPNQFIPSVEKGVRAAMEDGVGTGYPMIDLKVELYDGKYHTVDSSGMAFQLAGSAAIKDAIDKVGVTVLEPIWSLQVMVPEAFTGDIMGDLQKRRGIPEGIDTIGAGRQIVNAKVPFAEITHYATDLRSMTGGQGTFSWNFSHYQDVPHDLAQKILEAAKEEAHA